MDLGETYDTTFGALEGVMVVPISSMSIELYTDPSGLSLYGPWPFLTPTLERPIVLFAEVAVVIETVAGLESIRTVFAETGSESMGILEAVANSSEFPAMEIAFIGLDDATRGAWPQVDLVLEGFRETEVLCTRGDREDGADAMPCLTGNGIGVSVNGIADVGGFLFKF